MNYNANLPESYDYLQNPQYFNHPNRTLVTGMLPQPLLSPLQDRVLVLLEPEPHDIGLVHVPESARKPGADGKSDKFVRRGLVVAVGPGDKLADGSRLPMELKRGDRIIYDHPSDHMLAVPSRVYHAPSDRFDTLDLDYVILREQQHVFAVIEA